MSDGENVTMTHPEIPDSAVTVTRRAFERVYSKKGWRLESDATPSASEKEETNDG